MEFRSLGSTGLRASAIGFGCMGLSQGYGSADDATSETTLRAALDGGVVLFDTAMSYGQGHNETLVGRVLNAHGGSDVQIATKVGITRDETGVQLDAHPSRIRGYAEASLRRLGRDVIDLYYLHRADPDVPIAESIGAMSQLVEEGLVRHLGVSEVTPAQLEEAHSTHPLAAVQFEWSLMWREPETSFIPTARRLGIGLVPYSPLGRGLLTHTLAPSEVATSPFRKSDPRFNDDALVQNLRQVEALSRVASSAGATAGQLALAWLLAQGSDVVPIPGTRTRSRAIENAEAAAIRLSEEDLTRLAMVAPPQAWAGDRTSFAVPVTRRAAGHP